MKIPQLFLFAILALGYTSCTCHEEPCHGTESMNFEFDGYAKNQLGVSVQLYEKGGNFSQLYKEESYNLIFWDMVDGKVFWEYRPNLQDVRQVDEFDYKFTLESDGSEVTITDLERNVVNIKDCNAGISGRRNDSPYKDGCPLTTLKADGAKLSVDANRVLHWVK